MTILVINNKGQYNHRIQRSLQYLKIPSKLVSNTLSIEEIEAKLAEIGLWWQMTDRDWATWGLSHIEWIKAH